MSGGFFDYQQYQLTDMADKTEELIASNDNNAKDSWGYTLGRGYTPATIKKFKMCNVCPECNNTGVRPIFQHAWQAPVEWNIWNDEDVPLVRCRHCASSTDYASIDLDCEDSYTDFDVELLRPLGFSFDRVASGDNPHAWALSQKSKTFGQATKDTVVDLIEKWESATIYGNGLVVLNSHRIKE